MKRRVADTNAQQEAMASSRPRKRPRKADGTMGVDHGGSSQRDASSGFTRRKTLSAPFGGDPVVPFDVLLEILSQLDIKDLLNLARASKHIRQDLVSSETVTLWRRKREEAGAPPPPLGFSEAKWVSFLFTSCCYSCGVANSKVEPYLLKRICAKCRKKNYVELWSQAPKYNKEMLKCVPYTNYHWKQHVKRVSYTRFVFTDDLSDIESQWRSLEAESETGDPQSSENLEAFKQERIQYVAQCQSDASQLRGWLESRQAQKWDENGVIRRQMGELIKERFYQLGTFMKCDIDEAVARAPGIRIGNGVKLTDAAWLKYEEALTSHIVYQRDRRHDSVREDRMSQLDRRLQDWKASLDIPTREFLAYPVLTDLYSCSEVASFRQLDCEIRLTDEHYQPLIDAFPQLSASFIANRKAKLRSVIPTCALRHDSPDSLEFATSTFRLGERFGSEQRWTFRPGDVVVGWNALSVCHFFHCKTMESLPCVFDPWLSKVSSGIINLCGLDPHTASVDDMDRLDERFMCVCHLKNVDSMSNDSLFEFETYTWRTALSHALVEHNCDSEPQDVGFLPLWRLPVPWIRRLVDLREVLNRHEDAGWVNLWRCNHCFPSNADESPRILDNMLEHLRDRHGIADPTIQDDYFLNEHHRKSWERPCKFSVSDGAVVHSEGVPPSGGLLS